VANKGIFKSKGSKAKKADIVNEAGGLAYAMDPRSGLAQLAMTGTLGTTFYSSGEDQLKSVLALASKCSPTFVAKVAVWARENGYMKDMPALLLAYLSGLSIVDGTAREPFIAAFGRVIDNPKMLRNFIQIIRSGEVGRKSLGATARRLIALWLNNAKPEYLVRNSTGSSPSLGDVIKLVHARPNDSAHEAVFGWLIGKGKLENPHLPQVVKDYEAFKREMGEQVPQGIPPEMLTGLTGFKPHHWTQVAKTASWHWTRMNLNTLARHGVLDDGAMRHMVAMRLADPEIIRKVNVFPYQLMTTYQNLEAKDSWKNDILPALQGAMEAAVANVPEIPGNVIVAIDVSGSMGSPVTGHGGKPTVTTCVDVAALMAASIVRKNPMAGIIRFDDQASWFRANNKESVLDLSIRLSARGGGTAVSSAFRKVLEDGAKVDTMIVVSDNMSWADYHGSGMYGHVATDTESARLWKEIRKKNLGAKLVLLDIQPYANSQIPDSPGVLNIGGFSDSVFDLISKFVKGELSYDKWAGEIEKITL
jgi:60 kDa SS-A/Ro ribonucleoprotein